MNAPVLRFTAGIGILGCLFLTASAALAETVTIKLASYQEVPAISSAASGSFRAFINDKAGTISYELSYSGLTGDVQQAHIHVGQASVNGAVSVFLCQTAVNPDPTGLAPQCPQSGTVTGILQSANMIEGGIVSQGIAPGEFGELLAAIRAGVAYANVHSSTFPGGELRGQLR
jgi:hypothetical protein